MQYIHLKKYLIQMVKDICIKCYMECCGDIYLIMNQDLHLWQINLHHLQHQ